MNHVTHVSVFFQEHGVNQDSTDSKEPTLFI